MQQNQKERRFSEAPQQQPVYRFPQNQKTQGWKPQQSFGGTVPSEQEAPITIQDRRALKRSHRKNRRKIFTLWNLFAVIGLITVIVQATRYLVIPFLVYLNTLTGGIL